MKAPLNPSGFFGRIPLEPHRMTDVVTATEDMIVLCHLGVPRLDLESWRLRVDGLVQTPLDLTFADLQRFPFVRIESVHQCAGSPLEPTVATRRVCNVVWGGVRLSEVLEKAKPDPDAAYVWSYGADYGTFAGENCDAYAKDLPLARVADDVLLAFDVNGKPLPPENGFPVRLVAPGFYGTNSVKWLTNLHLAKTRAAGPFTTRFYNDPFIDEFGKETGQTTPVWSIAPESVIVSPSPGAAMALGKPLQIRGWAWGDDDVTRVDVSCDGGRSWHIADLALRKRREWQAFSVDWTPEQPGQTVILSRAANAKGMTQPLEGKRNAIHRVAIEVR